jgi:hypothetical protein
MIFYPFDGKLYQRPNGLPGLQTKLFQISYKLFCCDKGRRIMILGSAIFCGFLC